jgi:hypothetical protein
MPGPAGVTGPQAPQGDPGPRLSSLEDLGGLSCRTDGQSGTVSVSYDAARRVVLTCVAGGEPPTAVKVNEFSTGVTGAATNEFVELVNARLVGGRSGRPQARLSVSDGFLRYHDRNEERGRFLHHRRPHAEGPQRRAVNGTQSADEHE